LSPEGLTGSSDRLSFLVREGQVGCRHGPNAAALERMDYLEFIARVYLEGRTGPAG
jgi:hypothetical protein